jgi:CHAD domain-containing protein
VRYAAEAAEPVLGKPAARFVEAVTELQDILGDHQDSVTAQEWLRRSADSPLAFAAGELSAVEREVAMVDRSAWKKKWKLISRKRLRRWMI